MVMSIVAQPLPRPLVSLLSGCGTTRQVQQIHSHTIKAGFFPADATVTSQLMRSLLSAQPLKTPDLDYALSLLYQTPRPSAFLYNTLIRAHARARFHERALLLFHRMLTEGHALPDQFTFPFVLKACADLSAIDEGEQTHCMALKTHFFNDDVFIQSSLVLMYAECGKLADAYRVFETMPYRDIVTWNSMIDGFAASGDMDSAQRCFDEMPERNIVSWNSMIGGYMRNCLSHEALKLFLEMQILGLEPDESTMVSVVSAISYLGLLKLGKRAHGYICRHEFPLDGALGVALINMYTKCGSLDAALRVFSTISSKNVGHWTCMIVGFAAHGLAQASLQLFTKMLNSGVKPNDVTFIGVLNACSHGGLVDEGLRYFNLMSSCGIEPRIQHYGCLVDLLGRSGHLEEAMELVLRLPMDPGFVIWGTLLAACRNHGNVEIAEIAAAKLIKHHPNHGSCYILLSNMYAGLRRWEDFRSMRRMMEERRADKVTGFSWIEVNGGVHKFVAGDRFHVRSREIYRMLEEIECNLRWAGYVPLACALANNKEMVGEEDICISNALR